MKGNMRFCVPCLFGVEGLVAQELRDMGLEQVQAENGRVLFSGGWEAMARANLPLWGAGAPAAGGVPRPLL